MREVWPWCVLCVCILRLLVCNKTKEGSFYFRCEHNLYLLNILKRQVQTGGKRHKDTRDILIKKDRLKRRSILLREQWESSLDLSYHHNMSRAASTLCLLVFTGNADMSRILLERTGILLAHVYFQICLVSVWKSSAECYMLISSTSLLRVTT